MRIQVISSVVFAVVLAFGTVACDKGDAPAPVEQAEGAAAPEAPKAPAAAPAVEVQSLVPCKGGADAKVVIYEVSEFQCPFCSRVGPTIKQIVDTYKDEVRVCFLANPLGFHNRAMPAAKASLAAHKQGKFWEFHDKAFANQKALTDANFEVWATELGLNLEQFKKDIADATIEKEIKRQQAAAVALGARGTPGFFINGELLSGAQPFNRFQVVIDKQLAATKALTDAGKSAADAWVEVASKANNGANFVKWIAKGETPPANAAPAQKQARKPRPVPKDVWRVTVGDGDPTRGNADALVKVVVFSEFQCPYCGRIKPTLDKIVETYKDDVAIVFKSNPLPFHKDAPLASEAAMEAHAQGKFWEYHDKLFANMKALKRNNLDSYAQELGLDMGKFKKALDTGAHKAKVAADMALASDVRAKGTPNSFVNGRQLTGAQPFDSFKAVIDEELAKAKKLVAAGTAAGDVYDATVAKGKVFKALDDTAHAMDTDGSPHLGPKNAKVKIFEFSDFQCPYCSRVAPILKQVQAKYPKDVAVYFKHFPLSFHKQAMVAAEASLAALDQGKFWEMHDKIFINMKIITPDSLEQWAGEVGLDVAKYKAFMEAGTGKAKIQKDMAEARKAGVRGTPSLYINGRKFEPPGMSPDAIGKVIEAEFLKK